MPFRNSCVTGVNVLELKKRFHEYIVCVVQPYLKFNILLRAATSWITILFRIWKLCSVSPLWLHMPWFYYLPSEGLKHGRNHSVIHGTDLYKRNVVFLRQLFTLCLSNFSITSIAFVSHDNFDYLLLCMKIYLFNPILYVMKRLLICNVVY